jgi:hypothetical protein
VSANLDLVRSIYANWERGDFRHVDSADLEIEFVIHGWIFPVHAKGLTEMAASVREIFSEIAEWHDVAEEYRELDADRVLVLNRLSGRGRGSGVGLTHTPQHTVRVFETHKGKVTRMSVYFDRDRALADLGLKEE